MIPKMSAFESFKELEEHFARGGSLNSYDMDWLLSWSPCLYGHEWNLDCQKISCAHSPGFGCHCTSCNLSDAASAHYIVDRGYDSAMSETRSQSSIEEYDAAQEAEYCIKCGHVDHRIQNCTEYCLRCETHDHSSRECQDSDSINDAVPVHYSEPPQEKPFEKEERLRSYFDGLTINERIDHLYESSRNISGEVGSNIHGWIDIFRERIDALEKILLNERVPAAAQNQCSTPGAKYTPPHIRNRKRNRTHVHNVRTVASIRTVLDVTNVVIPIEMTLTTFKSEI